MYYILFFSFLLFQLKRSILFFFNIIKSSPTTIIIVIITKQCRRSKGSLTSDMQITIRERAALGKKKVCNAEGQLLHGGQQYNIIIIVFGRNCQEDIQIVHLRLFIVMLLS